MAGSQGNLCFGLRSCCCLVWLGECHAIVANAPQMTTVNYRSFLAGMQRSVRTQMLVTYYFW